MYVPKEGSGTLFVNQKQKDNQPDYRGDAMINGVVMEIAGWAKQGVKGTYISLSIKPKQERAEAAPVTPAAPNEPQQVALNDEIPW